MNLSVVEYINDCKFICNIFFKKWCEWNNFNSLCICLDCVFINKIKKILAILLIFITSGSSCPRVFNIKFLLYHCVMFID